MINKRELFKKLKKNRFLVLAISVIVITGVYYGAQKAIDSYSFKSDDEWTEFEKLFGGDEDDVQEVGVEEGVGAEDNDGEGASEADNSGKMPEDEVDLELEEMEESATDVEEKAGQEGEENSGAEEKIYVYITGEVNVPRSSNFE